MTVVGQESLELNLADIWNRGPHHTVVGHGVDRLGKKKSKEGSSG